MTVHNGRVETRVVVPTGGWDVTYNEGGGPVTVTIPAGSYWASDMPTQLQSAIENVSINAWDCTIANGESGTGLVTIDVPGTASITWTDTDLRDVLGFTGNLSGAGSYTGTWGARGMWMPDSPLVSPYTAGDAGHWEGGPVQTISPLGVTKTITRPTRVKCGPFRWTHVSLARARQYSESAPARSFERLLRDAFFAQQSYFMPGDIMRLYWNADDSAYVEFYPQAPASTESIRAHEEWHGLWACSIEGWET